jgi:hypothetical protein
MMQQPLVGQNLLINEVLRSHSGTQQSVGFLWKKRQTEAEQQTTLTREMHPCPRRYSNPQPKQASKQAVADSRNDDNNDNANNNNNNNNPALVL